MLKFQRIVQLMLCLLVIATFIGCASTNNQSSTGEYIDDSVITTKVKSAIFTEPDLKSLQISVETFKGAVQLSGFVDSTQSAKRATDVARGVNGVISVENDLIVR